MTIGILGAMIEEVSAIKEMMLIDKEVTYGGRTYTIGTIDDHEVILTFSRWGKVASASTTTSLINKFNVNSIIFTGVAGAVDKKLNIGDIVVGNGFYQHDMDARPLFEQFQIPLTDHIVFQPKNTDLLRANLALENFLNIIEHSIGSELLIKHSISKPEVYSGLIASGDQFITNPASHAALYYSHENQHTLAVEMEGAAVAQVCHEHDIPYIIIRTISDKADHCAAVDFQSFIKDIASKYASGIVKEYLALMSHESNKTIRRATAPLY